MMTYIAISRALRAAAAKNREEHAKQSVIHHDPIVAAQARLQQPKVEPRR